jgi:hypothetical protein
MGWRGRGGRTVWTIQVNQDGTAEVLRNGRRVQGDRSREEALRYIRRRWSAEHQVIQEDPDGARRDITRRVRATV